MWRQSSYTRQTEEFTTRQEHSHDITTQVKVSFFICLNKQTNKKNLKEALVWLTTANAAVYRDYKPQHIPTNKATSFAPTRKQHELNTLKYACPQTPRATEYNNSLFIRWSAAKASVSILKKSVSLLIPKPWNFIIKRADNQLPTFQERWAWSSQL